MRNLENQKYQHENICKSSFSDEISTQRREYFGSNYNLDHDENKDRSADFNLERKKMSIELCVSILLWNLTSRIPSRNWN